MDIDYSKLKNILEDLVKTKSIDKYIKILLNNLKDISSFNELNQFIILFILIEREYKNHTLERYNKEYTQIVYEIQIKYIQLANNISGELKSIRDTIYLFEIVSQIPNLQTNIQFINILAQIKEQYKQLGYSSDIQIFVNDVLMLGEVLTNDENYLKNYLQRVFILQIHKMTNLGYNTFLRQFLKHSNLEFNFILKGLDELFNEEKYFSLNNIGRRSIFNWTVHFLSNIPEYHNHSGWSVLYAKWKNLLFKHLENGQKDEAMYLEFFIWHIMGNLFQTQDEMKKFNEEITYPTSLYYKNEELLKHKKNHNKKTKIALIKDRIADTSVTKVELSLVISEYLNTKNRNT